jgi:DNA polymerase IV
MDAFYASVEQRDNPELRHKPLAVGGGGPRGVVAAASYEARQFGIHSAMPGVTALKKCPHLIFVRPRFSVYQAVSRHICDIFFEYTNLVEPLSLDEAYLDVSEPLKGPRSATLIAKEIRCRISEELQLTCSAGISYNKFLAKMASEVNKPNGYFVIHPEEAPSFIDRLPIGKFHGVGKVTAEKFDKLGITNGKDLRQADLKFLLDNFGKNGLYFYEIAQGNDLRPVEPHRICKSVGAENTFLEDLLETPDLEKELEIICTDVFERLQNERRFGKTLTLKIKYYDFTQITRSRTFLQPLTSLEQLLNLSCDLLEKNREHDRPIRLLGVTVSQLEMTGPGKQLRIVFKD